MPIIKMQTKYSTISLQHLRIIKISASNTQISVFRSWTIDWENSTSPPSYTLGFKNLVARPPIGCWEATNWHTHARTHARTHTHTHTQNGEKAGCSLLCSEDRYCHELISILSNTINLETIKLSNPAVTTWGWDSVRCLGVEVSACRAEAGNRSGIVSLYSSTEH